MTITEFIPKIDDIYTDEKGYLHTDINLPVSEENNYVLFDRFNKDNAIIPRVKELYDFTGWKVKSLYTELDCYLIIIWEKE